MLLVIASHNRNILLAFWLKMINDFSTWIKSNMMEIVIIKIIFAFHFRHVLMLQKSLWIMQKLLWDCKYLWLDLISNKRHKVGRG